MTIDLVSRAAVLDILSQLGAGQTAHETAARLVRNLPTSPAASSAVATLERVRDAISQPAQALVSEADNATATATPTPTTSAAFVEECARRGWEAAERKMGSDVQPHWWLEERCEGDRVHARTFAEHVLTRAFERFAAEARTEDAVDAFINRRDFSFFDDPRKVVSAGINALLAHIRATCAAKGNDR